MCVMVVRSPSPRERLTQPSLPFGRSVLVMPTQSPRLAATASVVGERNWVVAPTRASTGPPGFERSATVWPARTCAIEKVGFGAGATGAAADSGLVPVGEADSGLAAVA